jgi:hypothetical protein
MRLGGELSYGVLFNLDGRILANKLVWLVMKKSDSRSGARHRTPADLREAIGSVAKAAWKDLTPLARNEWICWVISAKQAATRAHRIQRAPVLRPLSARWSLRGIDCKSSSAQRL